jgi:hypothetical protein
MAIPEARSDGYLPEGVHEGSEPEVKARFGAANVRRMYLWSRVARWIELGRKTGASRLLIDGSFVTAVDNPADVDAVVLLSDKFHRDFFYGTEEAVELYGMLVNKEPEELFAAEDEPTWLTWIEFFSRVRDNPSVRKGLVEIKL